MGFGMSINPVSIALKTMLSQTHAVQAQVETQGLRQRNAKLGQAPATVVANLLDDGIYLCSARTMYRILCFKLTR